MAETSGRLLRAASTRTLRAGVLGEEPRAVGDDLTLSKYSEERLPIGEGGGRRYGRAQPDNDRRDERVGHLPVELEPGTSVPAGGVESNRGWRANRHRWAGPPVGEQRCE